MEPDRRYYRRRANEELAAANRAVTDAARERRLQLAQVFLQRLRDVETRVDYERPSRSLFVSTAANDHPAFEWRETSRREHA